MARNTEITNTIFITVYIKRESAPFIVKSARQIIDAAPAEASGRRIDLSAKMRNFILFFSLMAERIKLKPSIIIITIA